MNEKFYELPKEKQLKMICAGMEHFGKYGYKKAKTDDIAASAGISKGLLFYYFKDKKSFYLYIYHFCEEILKEMLSMEEIDKMDDFFDIMDYGASKKFEMCILYPYMADFIMQSFQSQKESVSSDLNQIFKDTIDKTFEIYFKNVDWSRFKEGIDPKKIYRMLLWMSEGYLFEKIKFQEFVTIEEMEEEFTQWKEMFKKMCYRKEYI